MRKFNLGTGLTLLDISISDPLNVVRDIFRRKKKNIIFKFPILITKNFSGLLLHILVGGPSKNLNSVSISRSCIFTTIFVNKNLDSITKSKFSIAWVLVQGNIHVVSYNVLDTYACGRHSTSHFRGRRGIGLTGP